MNNELLATLEYIEQERGISKMQLIDAVEKALLQASRKSIHPASDLSVKINPRSGEIKAWAKLKVVETFANKDEITLSEVQKAGKTANIGDIIDWEVTPRNFGRIAAQTARQAIIQKIREVEREAITGEFEDKVGEIIHGNVRHVESGNIIVEVKKTEGMISIKDQIPTEQFTAGEGVNALLVGINSKNSGPALILNRSGNNFLRKLLEREVSEIHDGIVEIVAIARDPGNRAKIAVRSNDPHVDPVGACVGLRGIRVKNIMNELDGERLDIIHYSEDLDEYVKNVMHPAKIDKIEYDNAKHSMTLYVNPDNSKLAFGKRGQNVRLARKLLGWGIVVEEKNPFAEFEEQKAELIEHLAASLNISEEAATLLVEKGYLSADGIRADLDNLSSATGLDAQSIQNIRAALAE